ncbi:MAG TPA: magnesium transporter, partial [Tepidisphaeraceae bacterium]|nr:magnesium transporter [Tepidisphaeraceae bacterium]
MDKQSEKEAADAAVERSEQMAVRVEDLPSADGAAILTDMPSAQAAGVAEALDPQTAADILAEMDHVRAASVISDMEPPEASTVLSYMDPDDRVDILEHVEAPLHDQLVDEMDAHEAAEVHHLEQYPPDTAGGRMTTQVTALYEHITVDNAVTILRQLSKELEQMFYVYVINKHKELVGVLSMRDLILADPKTVLSSIMIRNVRSVEAATDQEAVARMMKKYGYLAMPVVDHNKRLLGLITLDDVIEVLEEETTEDVQKLFGAGAEERLSSPWHFSFRSRVWWLVINLGTAFMAGAVVGIFEGTIAEMAVLAIYMPIVAGMGGNASAQAMAVAVRGIAVGEVDRKLLRHVMSRELVVGVLTGLVCGIITAAVAVLWQGNPMLGVVVGLALVINHTLASSTGAGIPFIMKRLGFDPAQSATIFATTVTDVGGFFCFLGLATLF